MWYFMLFAAINGTLVWLWYDAYREWKDRG
jgi:hypothetical protein